MEACPPSVGYKLTKFVRKHRAALTVASFFVSLLVLGVVVSVVLTVRAGNAEWATKQEQGKTEETLTRVQNEQGKTKAALAQAED